MWANLLVLNLIGCKWMLFLLFCAKGHHSVILWILLDTANPTIDMLGSHGRY